LQDAFKNEQVLQLVNARRFVMNLAYIIFCIYLILIGILSYKASYAPQSILFKKVRPVDV
ncbi:MAG: hypothetical protein ABR503_14865, partial [Chitinophagaceae bacterium]